MIVHKWKLTARFKSSLYYYDCVDLVLPSCMYSTLFKLPLNSLLNVSRMFKHGDIPVSMTYFLFGALRTLDVYSSESVTDHSHPGGVKY